MLKVPLLHPPIVQTPSKAGSLGLAVAIKSARAPESPATLVFRGPTILLGMRIVFTTGTKKSLGATFAQRRRLSAAPTPLRDTTVSVTLTSNSPSSAEDVRLVLPIPWGMLREVSVMRLVEECFGLVYDRQQPLEELSTAARASTNSIGL